MVTLIALYAMYNAPHIDSSAVARGVAGLKLHFESPLKINEREREKK
jgi:hypothetical protein